jgi:hypothetical protein
MIKTIRSAKNRSRKYNNHRKTKKTNRRSCGTPIMRGGDTGRYVLPAEYFGNNSGAYVAEPASLKGQIAVSQGVIHPGGLFAGPNLKPGMSGGGCGCRRLSKSHRKNKHRNSKNRKH